MSKNIWLKRENEREWCCKFDDNVVNYIAIFCQRSFRARPKNIFFDLFFFRLSRALTLRDREKFWKQIRNFHEERDNLHARGNPRASFYENHRVNSRARMYATRAKRDLEVTFVCPTGQSLAWSAEGKGREKERESIRGIDESRGSRWRESVAG